MDSVLELEIEFCFLKDEFHRKYPRTKKIVKKDCFFVVASVKFMCVCVFGHQTMIETNWLKVKPNKFTLFQRPKYRTEMNGCVQAFRTLVNIGN